MTKKLMASYHLRLAAALCALLLSLNCILAVPRKKPDAKRGNTKTNSSETRASRLTVSDDDTAYDGDFVGPSNGRFPLEYQRYDANTPVAAIEPVLPAGRSGSGETIWYVNGIRNTIGEQYATMKLIANRSGNPVIGIHNATKWRGVADGVQSAGDLLSLSSNRATETLAFALFSQLEADRKVHLFGHSQGTIIINDAIKKVKNTYEAKGKSFCEILQKLNLIRAEIFGSPVPYFVNGPAYIHICNYKDPVCNLAGIRQRTDQEIEAEISASKIVKSKLQAEVYGANSLVFNSYYKNSPGIGHSIDDFYISIRGAAVFPPPPTCSANLFLFDTSGSMADGGKWDGGLKSLLELLERFDETTKVQAGFFPTSVMSFAGECTKSSSRTLFDFTLDIKSIRDRLPGTLPRPGGGTPLMISFEVAMDKLNEFIKKNPSIEDHGACLITDGEDTCGTIRPDGVWGNGGQKLRGSALLSRVPKSTNVNTIGYDLVPGSKGERDLQYVAFVTGGRYYNAADPRQLKRAIQKTTQSYSPRNIALADSQSLKFRDVLEKAGIALQQKKFVEALKLYRQLEADFKRDGKTSSELYYNLAQALEANDRYKGALEYYQLYLKSSPQAADRVVVEQKVTQLRQDYKDQFEYYLKIIESDLVYLKKFYSDLFNQRNDVLAAEFAGFVTEKGEFYTNLQDILEVRTTELKNHSKDLSDGLYNLSDKVDSNVFDRDAISLLTVPISELEELLELLKRDKSRLLTI